MKEELKKLEELCNDLDNANQLFYFAKRGITTCDQDILEDKLSQADFVEKISSTLECIIDMYNSKINSLWNIWNAMSEIEWKKENDTNPRAQADRI